MPATSAAFAGSVALPSVEVIPTVWVLTTTRFQLASTALTVTANDVPAGVRGGCAGLAASAVPGAAVSPGNSSCSFANAPALTVTDGEVFAVFVPSLMSVAVNVGVPAVLRVTL